MTSASNISSSLSRPDLLRFWAKTSDDPLRPDAYHPLICHMIDVACVALEMWNGVLANATKARLGQALGYDPDNKKAIQAAGIFIAFIAGLHDLGKCSPPFALRGHNEAGQATAALLDLYRPGQYWLDAVAAAREVPHGYVTAVELPAILVRDFDLNEKVADQIGTVIGGHHGIFPGPDWRQGGRKATPGNLGGSVWANARRELAQRLAALLDVKRVDHRSSAALDNGSVMVLAGLVSVADWIGSNTDFFDSAVDDFTSPDFCLRQGSCEEYVGHAKRMATEALQRLGWSAWPEYREPKRFRDLFTFEPRALQQVAIDVATELASQGVVVIESPMGEGKTEAAMYLADHFNSVLGQRGIYFALPTMATSDQMFGRVKEFLSSRFGAGCTNIQLQLAHGHAALSAEFDTMKDAFRDIKGVFEECRGHDCVPNVVAAEWFTYRKRSLLAPFGVGTIDQALMAVLQTKHVFVRLFGLAHKTVIIDEVHAYDAYMSALLERLLEWLAALGSPVILLSATLPKERRNKLIQAYQRGLNVDTGTRTDPPGVDDHYPRITWATDPIIKVRHIDTSTKAQTLRIAKIGDDELLLKLKEKLTGGGCVAIICNTVGRAQEVFQRLAEDDLFRDESQPDGLRRDLVDGLPILDLLHARFRYIDREERTDRCLVRFGKPGGRVRVRSGSSSDAASRNEISVVRPHTAVLVSTQIIEQSLDLDFDLMISDLAPVDLLLQRAGRLHRHDRDPASVRSEDRRPDAFREIGSELWIVEPEMKPDGLPDFKNSIVYDQHINLRTWLTLNGKSRIGIPTEVEHLIEKVYDLGAPNEDTEERVAAHWRRTLAECLNSFKEDESEAADRYIKRPSYGRHLSGILRNTLEEDSPEIHRTLQAVTRLIEPTVNVVCVFERNGRIFINEQFEEQLDLATKPSFDRSKELLKHSASISSRSVVFQLLAEEVPVGWRESPLLRRHRVLIFNERRHCEMFGHQFRLDGNRGLEISKVP